MNFPSYLIKAAANLVLLSRTRPLSPEELKDLKDILGELGSEDIEALSKELLSPSLLKDAFEVFEMAERSKETALKKIWEKINGENK